MTGLRITQLPEGFTRLVKDKAAIVGEGIVWVPTEEAQREEAIIRISARAVASDVTVSRATGELGITLRKDDRIKALKTTKLRLVGVQGRHMSWTRTEGKDVRTCNTWLFKREGRIFRLDYQAREPWGSHPDRLKIKDELPSELAFD